MQADGFPHNPRRVEHALKILDQNKNAGNDQWMKPVAPLKCRDQNRRHPANHNSDVRNHRQDDDEQADQWRKIQTEESERAANESSVNKAYEQLAPKIGNDVIVYLQQGGRDFIL